MPPKKTPTSSLSGTAHAIHFTLFYLTIVTATAFELFINRIWYRTLAVIKILFSGGAPPETSMAYSSPAARLPMEVVETIIAYLIHDRHSLRTCTMTCYSWYIIAVHHLHRTLIAPTCPLHKPEGSLWPKQLLYKQKLGLFPLVNSFWVRGDGSGLVKFSPKLFNCSTPCPFFALTNVRRLRIDYLDIPSFMPRIRRYFKHFLPTLQSLALEGPKGSCRQIIYFIGLFQHLQDLLLLNIGAKSREKPADNRALIPRFIPPLQGSLVMLYIARVDLAKEFIDLFGGIRFRRMELLDVEGMELLLNACAGTLESVLLDPTDPRGEQLSLKGMRVLANNFAAISSLQDFDLSRSKSLRALNFLASSINYTTSDSSPDATCFLKHVLSTITSSVFFKITVEYDEGDFRGIEYYDPDRPPFRELSQAERAEEASWHHRLFELLREVHKVRSFQLVLCVSVCGCVGEYPVQMLEVAVAEEKAKNGFDSFSSDPLVRYNPQEGCHGCLGECCAAGRITSGFPVATTPL